VAALAAELGVDPTLVEVSTLLGVAGDVAHHVARPAAPISTFLVALAAAADGGDAAAVLRASAKAAAFARAWPTAQSHS
jgi:hypothetical protein